MRKLMMKIKEWIVWIFSRRVGEAINAGLPYEEVVRIVREEVER